MTRYLHIPLSAAIATVATFLAVSGPVEAKNRETAGLGACWLQGKIVYTPGSTTAKCCYDDGCYVCDTSWNNCTWQTKAAAIRDQVVPGGGTNAQTDSPSRKPDVVPGWVMKKNYQVQ